MENSGQISRRLLTLSMEAGPSKSLASFEQRNGCMKVNDPFYGKRRQPETLKRIQRKIKLSHQNKKAVNGAERLEHVESLEGKKEKFESEVKLKEKKNNSTKGESKGTKIENNIWITQDEFLAVFYRLL